MCLWGCDSIGLYGSLHRWTDLCLSHPNSSRNFIFNIQSKSDKWQFQNLNPFQIQSFITINRLYVIQLKESNTKIARKQIQVWCLFVKFVIDSLLISPVEWSYVKFKLAYALHLVRNTIVVDYHSSHLLYLILGISKFYSTQQQSKVGHFTA